MEKLIIEDDDGFTTEWDWPENKLVLANAEFVAIYEQRHDQMRKEAGLE